MTLAVVGPLPPVRSGIADYSAVLLRQLRRHFRHLAVVTGNGIAPDLGSWEVDGIYHADDTRWWRSGRTIPLYQMGNHSGYHDYVYDLLQRFPGVTVLHDGTLLPFVNAVTLGRSSRADYVREIGYSDRSDSGHQMAWRSLRAAAALDAGQWPMLARVLDASLGTVVHSVYMRDRVREVRPDAKVTVIPLIDTTPIPREAVPADAAKAAVGYDPGILLLGTFGFIAPSKRLDSVLQALARLRDAFPHLHLVCVGEVVQGYDLPSQVAALGLDDRVRITGYVPDADMARYIQAVDVGLNLRYPTWGESSSSLVRLMSASRPVVVSDVAAFAELPQGIVARIPTGDLEVAALVETLAYLLANAGEAREMGRAARDYVASNCAPTKVARQYAGFIHDCIRELGV